MTKATINALVLGAGRFGRHYVRILAQLNSRQYAALPQIAKLIVTRTTQAGAREVVDTVENGLQSSVEAVIAEKVADDEDLNRLLKRYRPGFIAIAARDRTAGDSIHGRYARIALSYGAVLCEKPFMPARGDGASLAALQSLKAKQYPHRLGLELPMAVVDKQMRKDPDIAKALHNSGSIRFIWESAVRGSVDLVDDLVLHPWSLLASEYDVRFTNILNRGNRADIQLQLTSLDAERRLPCSIQLAKGGQRRCMSLDNMTLVFKSDGPWVRVFEADGPLKESTARQSLMKSAREVLAVYNPIEQHIVATLQHHPIIGLDRIAKSQLLLEHLHGYRKTH